MAVLFSAVTLTADNNQVEFLAAGVPRDADDLEGWTAYENFMDELDSEQEVSVHVEAYLYGEGKTAGRSASKTLQTSSGISSSEPSWWRWRTNTTPISSASPVW